MFRVVPAPIIRSAYNCIYSIWYLLHRYCYLPLSWKSWNSRSNSSTIVADSSTFTPRSINSGLITSDCCGMFCSKFSFTRIMIIPFPIYIQQDATLHSLFISGNCSTCFGWYLHPSSGAYTTVSTASGICHTVTATCRYSGR